MERVRSGVHATSNVTGVDPLMIELQELRLKYVPLSLSFGHVAGLRSSTSFRRVTGAKKRKFKNSPSVGQPQMGERHVENDG